MSRRPAALVAPPVARLIGYALLAGVGSLEWVRYVQGASSARALAWVAAGLLSGALVLLAARLPGRRATAGLAAAPVAGLALALAASGLDLQYLVPDHWDELADGLARGAAALNTVRLPYLGREPWVLTTVQLAGAGLCWAAAVLACWPRGRGGPRRAALALLLVLVAAPVVSLGATRPIPLGLTLAALTAAFLWLERLSRRPGLGLAALGAAALLTAVPLGAAADREAPWFDYKAFSERLGGGTPVTFDWEHDYGPIDWPREGVELFRVRSPKPYYWKAQTLNSFDGREWTSSSSTGVAGDAPRDDLPAGGNPHPEWDTRFTVALRRLKTPLVVGAGTILDVAGATQPVEPARVPGQWETSGTHSLSKGDSYEVRAHVPRPSSEQLAAATVGRDARRRSSLLIHVGLRPDASAPLLLSAPRRGRERVPLDEADVRFAPFESGRKPVVLYWRLGTSSPGAPALRNSYYDRTWALAQRLRKPATSPYDYVVRVNNYLRGPDFGYTEVPPPSGDEAPLESFLLDTRRGYCQQFSGAMVLLLRMGGVPARVAAGFSPGGLRTSSGEWVIRDIDAHSWVEAWFDGLGWVTFDPTPPQTPARSQIAAIAPPAADAPDTSGFRDAPGASSRRQRLDGTRREPAADTGVRARRDGAPVWPWVAIGAALAAAAAAALAATRARRFNGPEGALDELERALRRSGRPAPTGTTLSQLERRLGASGDGYLRALRATRYGPAPAQPSRGQRAGFRRELATGLGWGGRLRSLWALPPLPPRTLRTRRAPVAQRIERPPPKR